MAATAICFNPTPTGQELCAWCDDEDRRQAVIAILWRHHPGDHAGQRSKAGGSYCEHVSWTCWRHIEKDADELRYLGFQVLGAKDTGL